jgi:NADPH2:quinone reductase
MRAIQVREYGGPEVLEPVELPDPVPGPGQVVVGLAFADVIFLDTLIRGGWGRTFMPRPLPYVPGTGGSGAVLAVGEGVDSTWIGRRVVARAATGYAERVVTDLDQVMEVPDGLGLAEAAAIMHDGATAVSVIRDSEPIEKGSWVLVAAAAGGAGSLILQLARDAGARVIAAARGERKLALARDLGAEAVVDYSTEGWEQDVRDLTGGRGVDLAIDGAGGPLGRAAFEAVAENGRFRTYGATTGQGADIDPDLARERKIDARNLLGGGPRDTATTRDLMARAIAYTVEGRIRPHIGATFPLERARDAHQALADRATVGKSLLVI